VAVVVMVGGEPGRARDAGRGGVVPGWWRVGAAGAGMVGAPGVAACVSPVLGAVLAVVDVVVPLVAALVVVGVVTCGSAEACNRVFRLLRWIADRPEPPGPGDPAPQ